VIYGYARVSSKEQDLTVQVESLKNAGCKNIRQEKVSGTSIQGRDELNVLLDFLREGDELVVTRVDRLARSIRDLQNIVHDLNQKGIVLRATEQPIDTTTSAGKCFLDMLGVFAEFETNLRKERQMEGIAKAKEKGVYKGRKASIDIDKVKELRESGMGATAIAKELGIGRASVYRVLEGKSNKETRLTKETNIEYLMRLVRQSHKKI
jgi:DNA invertase Pin-like site-specific DNA recombinase